MGFDTAQNSMQKLSQILGHKKISNQSPLRTTNYTGTVVTIALVSLASEYSVAVRILVSSTFIYKDKACIHSPSPSFVISSYGNFQCSCDVNDRMHFKSTSFTTATREPILESSLKLLIPDLLLGFPLFCTMEMDN